MSDTFDPLTADASRELDAAVAEAMGWRNISQYAGGLTGQRPGMSGPYATKYIPAFSADIEAAWEVVVWLASRCDMVQPGWVIDGWCCYLCLKDRAAPAVQLTAHAETPELAICRALLKVKQKGWLGDSK